MRAGLDDLSTESLDWPGLGDVPPDPRIEGFGDLAALVVDHLDEPTALVGQSMGGYVAVLAALAAPERVSHLVLAVTSAGLDLAALGAVDWRPGARAARPADPAWLFADQLDLTSRIDTIDVPTLLVWADADPISPLAVGRRLHELLPRSELVVFESDDHWVVREHADDVAARIRRHVTG